MKATKGSKANGRQSQKKKGYYTRQFQRTEANKLRRARKLIGVKHVAILSPWRKEVNTAKQARRKWRNAIVGINKKPTAPA